MGTGYELVLNTLQKASSQNPDELKPAEEQLKSWETEKGFYSTLIEIVSQHSIDLYVRWLAVLYFKNGIDKYWRKTAPFAISEDEKTRIRFILLQITSEPAPQIATQLAVLTSKLARVDFPHEWPVLLPTLIERMKGNDDLVRHRTLLTLHHVIKQLSSKRLAADRRIFLELCGQMFVFLFEYWESQTETFLSMPEIFPTLFATLERSHLSLKILRKFLIQGFKKPHESSGAIAFVHRVFDRMKVMLEFRKRHENNESFLQLSEKYCVLLTKVLIDLLETHPFSYLQFIKPSLELTLCYAFTPEGEHLVFQRFIVQCLNLMKMIIVCPEYRPCKVIEDTANIETLEAHKLKAEFFTDSISVGIFNKLLSHYFLLTQEDLELWDSDPEGFCLEIDGGESWRYSLKPCTEALFDVLFFEYRKALTPSLLELVKASRTLIPPDDFQGICQKDAIYSAVGLSAFLLYDDIDFDEWFKSTLINELKLKESNYRILRRRVIWLIGQWTNVKFAPENKSMLYEAIIHLLSGEEDFVVRISAALAFKNAVDDFGFDQDTFSPYLPTMFAMLFNLLKEAKECDTKMQVLHVMSFMIDVIGSGIQPHAGPLVQYLPALWEESANHNMLRCAILTTLVYIVSGLMRESEGLYEFLLPIIEIATNVNDSSHIYLLEDGLQLWLTTIDNCHTPSDKLLNLFDNMIPLLEISSENLKLCFQITNAYIVICPQRFLSKYGLPLIETCNSLLKDLRSEGLVFVLKCIEMMLRALPQDSPHLLQSVIPSFILTIIEEDLYPMVLSMYLSLLARLVLYAENSFTWCITKAAEDSKKSEELILAELLKVWSGKLSLVSPEERSKLCALGLAQLCGSNWPPVISMWPSAIEAISEVVFDMTLEGSTDDKLLVQQLRCSPSESIERDSEHVHRIHLLAREDPVHTTNLRNFLAQQLRKFESLVGPNTVADLFQRLEEDCKTLLREITAS